MSGKVAVIVPVFNSEKYLNQCVDSILNQSYKEFILVVVNDGSTDGSCDILNSYEKKDARVVLLSQKNQGVAKARNAGLEFVEKSTDAKYIAFVDSDDILEPDFIRFHLLYLKKHKVDVSICSFSAIREKEKDIKKKIYKKTLMTKRDYIHMIFSYGEWSDVWGRGGTVWKQVYKLSAVSGIRFPEDKRLVEDEVYCVKVAKSVERFVYIPKELYRYRFRSGSLSRQKQFLKQLVCSRKLSLELSKDFSKDLRMVIFQAYLKLLLKLIKGGELTCDLSPYTSFVNEMYRENVISAKFFQKFMVLRYMPNLAQKVYSLENLIRRCKKMLFKSV